VVLIGLCQGRCGCLLQPGVVVLVAWCDCADVAVLTGLYQGRCGCLPQPGVVVLVAWCDCADVAVLTGLRQMSMRLPPAARCGGATCMADRLLPATSEYIRIDRSEENNCAAEKGNKSTGLMQ
jgi:energy-converting hydrogenase Eha subunit C